MQYALAAAALVVAVGGGLLVGLRHGLRVGAKKGVVKTAEVMSSPEFIAHAVVHAEGCGNCGPALKQAEAKARLVGVPTDHKDALTGQYL